MAEAGATTEGTVEKPPVVETQVETPVAETHDEPDREPGGDTPQDIRARKEYRLRKRLENELFELQQERAATNARLKTLEEVTKQAVAVQLGGDGVIQHFGFDRCKQAIHLRTPKARGIHQQNHVRRGGRAFGLEALQDTGIVGIHPFNLDAGGLGEGPVQLRVTRVVTSRIHIEHFVLCRHRGHTRTQYCDGHSDEAGDWSCHKRKGKLQSK